ncbi:YrzQ family protein [Bacillus mesophilum]|uniref:DUF3918 domain-containing protein n=1 Tax=Bacillus mesophilum TaxID=1071718 RepID=A0A7V7UWB6_9BACI|nr:YrzQ family protein [Bacillus mesophilum]KAB2334016.1 DUF3918 domain-containing protein [Bacillus mesophilum]
MNKILTSAALIGAGYAVYNAAQKNKMFSSRNMKKIQKKMTKALF